MRIYADFRFAIRTFPKFNSKTRAKAPKNMPMAKVKCSNWGMLKCIDKFNL